MTQPVRSAQGSTRKVTGSGTSTMSGKPVSSGMSKPPPSTNNGVKTLLALSMLSSAAEKSMPLLSDAR